MFGETRYREAFERGLAWADEIFDAWLDDGRALPEELPTRKYEIPVTRNEPADDADWQTRARAESVLYAAARVRWRRRFSHTVGRRAS
jgi:hypothetical protein